MRVWVWHLLPLMVTLGDGSAAATHGQHPEFRSRDWQGPCFASRSQGAKAVQDVWPMHTSYAPGSLNMIDQPKNRVKDGVLPVASRTHLQPIFNRYTERPIVAYATAPTAGPYCVIPLLMRLSQDDKVNWRVHFEVCLDYVVCIGNKPKRPRGHTMALCTLCMDLCEPGQLTQVLRIRFSSIRPGQDIHHRPSFSFSAAIMILSSSLSCSSGSGGTACVSIISLASSLARTTTSLEPCWVHDS